MLSSDSKIHDQAYKFFTQEALEFLQTLEEGLLTLRQDRSTPKVHALMRAAHSIKGGAASVGLPAIQTLAHQLEDVLRALYREEVTIDLTLEETLLQAYDCLRSPLVEQIQTGFHNEREALARSEAVFAHLAEQLGDALQQGETALPTAAELGVDVVQVIFAGDVENGLKRLQSVLENPAAYEVAGEIRAQAEVFAGVGELVNLPGFTAIARATLAALENYPDRMEAIGQRALADFQAAQATVLAGDRIRGGVVSPALQQLAQPLEPLSPKVVDLVSADRLIQPNFSDLEDFDALFTDIQVNNPDHDDLFSELLSDTTFDSQLDAIELEISSESIDPSVPLISPNFSEENTPGPLASGSEGATSIPDHSFQPAPDLVKTVRVDLERLERLNNLVGELMTQENSTLLQQRQLQEVVGRVSQRFTRFEAISRELETWSDRSQNRHARLPQAASQAQNSQLKRAIVSLPALSDTEFDPLQMESYSDLYTLVQETLEEIAQVGEAMGDMVLLTQQSQQLQRQKQQTLKHIRNDLLWARMLPLGDILNRFPRMVRDLSARYGKQVTLKLVGAATLVDKAMLEKLYDPLVHLVRNAFDHGIESSGLRQAQQKPAEATIEIRACHRGNQTYIEIQDDGQGIDLAAVRTRAIELKLVSPQEARALSDDQLYEFLFAPGFSTAAQITQLSGRGMGLDTVLSQVKSLKGTILVRSQPGQGTTFILRLPLTLTIAKLLVFSCNSHLMAIPIDSLAEIVVAAPEQIHAVQGERFLRWQEQLVPIYSSSVFCHHYLLLKPTSEQIQAMPMPQGGRVPLLLIAGESQIVALQVDQILQEQELAIKPFGRAVVPPAYLYGCTILGDGSLVPVIDGAMLIEQKQADPLAEAVAPGQSQVSQASAPEASPSLVAKTGVGAKKQGANPPGTVLVADDSLTTRQTLTLTLKKAGYRVIQARDGREALEHLQHNAAIDAVFCDVEMPRMNGFEFLHHCRQRFSPAVLPVIMLSSRSSNKHRQIAHYLGASNYLTKPYLEPELLHLLRTVLAEVAPVS